MRISGATAIVTGANGGIGFAVEQVDAAEAGEEDVIPDRTAKDVGAVWRADPKAVERRSTAA